MEPSGAKNSALNAAVMPSAAGYPFGMAGPRCHTGASLKGRPITEPTDAPICSAPDSIPTDAPPSTLRHVPARMPGATPPEMRSLARNWSMTLSVARFTGRRSSLYSPMDASPKAGNANKSQG